MSAHHLGIGLLGGAFDPPHRGHHALATQGLKQLPIKQVLWIPTARPPHKNSCEANFEHRCAMVSQLINDENRFLLDTLEEAIPGPSFFYKTIDALATRYAHQELWLLLGLDQFKNITHWEKANIFLKHINLAVMDRELNLNSADTFDQQKHHILSNYSSDKPKQIKWIESSTIPITSSEVREDFKSINSELLFTQTREYIDTHQLYR